MRTIASLVIYFSILMFPHYNIQAESQHKIEIFDIQQGKVIHTAPSNMEIEKQVDLLMKSITDVYRAFEPIPHKGFMVKIPLEKPISLKNDYFDDLVNEVILIFPEYENPHMMVVNDENRPYFFSFNKSVDEILALIKFNPVRPRKSE